jgi:cell division protein FtsB
LAPAARGAGYNADYADRLPETLGIPSMKVLGILLGLLLALIQYPLWLGKGGWMRVWELDRQVMLQASNNNRLGERNAGLESEVRDLREGLLAVEERARYELGMVRPDEVFVQFNEAPKQTPINKGDRARQDVKTAAVQ